MQEYKEVAAKQAEAKKNIPPPVYEKDAKLVDLPRPTLAIRKYNDPPGAVEINLTSLIKKRKINSIGAASPDHTKLAYTSVFYYPGTKTASSELYLMDLDTSLDLETRLSDAHVFNGQKMVFKTGMNALELNVQKTLTILDWSSDGKRIALKEKVSYSEDGLWQTNLLVYDIGTGKTKNLSEVREAIKYYWRKTEKLDLGSNRWDIFPMGWDALNPDRIIVFAYAYTGERPKYLGTWSVDYSGDRSMLMSRSNSNFEVSQNGISLKLIAD